VGNIYPPSHIYIDTSFASTLDSQSISSGLAEGVKIVFARGDTFFDDFVGNPASQNPHDQNHLLELIYLTLSSKKWFIEIDEFDKAERQLLNFGHSFGHAYEAACDFTIQHGLGVAIGVLAALNHPAATHNRSTESLSEYCQQLARKHPEILRDSLSCVDWNTFEKSLRSDKKNTSDSLVLILPSKDQLSRIQLPYADKSLQIATKTMQDVLNSIVSESE
jgi:3-dehydroquinate synthase